MTAAARAVVVPPPTTTITSNFANLAAVQKAMHAKLRESTLTPADATKLRLQPCTAQQCAKLNLVVARAGFRIPYFDLSGRPTSFYRYRYLEYDNA
jgi:hypothetical protein